MIVRPGDGNSGGDPPSCAFACRVPGRDLDWRALGGPELGCAPRALASRPSTCPPQRTQRLPCPRPSARRRPSGFAKSGTRTLRTRSAVDGRSGAGTGGAAFSGVGTWTACWRGPAARIRAAVRGGHASLGLVPGPGKRKRSLGDRRRNFRRPGGRSARATAVFGRNRAIRRTRPEETSPPRTGPSGGCQSLEPYVNLHIILCRHPSKKALWRPAQGESRIAAVKLLRPLGLLMSVSLGGPAAAQTLQSSQADFSRGQALIIAKKPADAAEKFEAVTKAEPDFAPGWYALGAARRRAGQCERAIAAYRRYAQMLPTEPEPYYGLGLCLKETGQLASASQALRRYVDLEKRPSSQKWVDHARSVIEEIGNGADAPNAS